MPDTPDVHALGDDPFSAVIGLFLLVLAIPALVVVLLLLTELLLLLVLLPLFVLVRLLLPVPWTLELWSRPARQRLLGWHLEHEVRVEGWKASRERLGTLATEVAALRPRDDWEPADRTGPEAVRGGGTPPSRESWAAGDAPTAPERGASDRPDVPNPFAQRDD